MATPTSGGKRIVGYGKLQLPSLNQGNIVSVGGGGPFCTLSQGRVLLEYLEAGTDFEIAYQNWSGGSTSGIGAVNAVNMQASFETLGGVITEALDSVGGTATLNMPANTFLAFMRVPGFVQAVDGQAWVRSTAIINLVANGTIRQGWRMLATINDRWSSDNTNNPAIVNTLDAVNRHLGGGFAAVNNYNIPVTAPFFVIGNPATYRPSALILGDSKNDSVTQGPTAPVNVGFQGWIGTAFKTASTPGGRVSFCNMATNGFSMLAYLNNTNGERTARLAAAPYSNNIVIDLGTNDAIVGATLSQMTSYASQIIDEWAALGYNVFWCTLGPKTTGAWNTLAAQTIPNTGAETGQWIEGGTVWQFNQLLMDRTSWLSRKLTGVFDVSTQLRDSVEWGKWRVADPAGVPTVYTADGLHGNGAAILLGSTVIDKTKLGTTNNPVYSFSLSVPATYFDTVGAPIFRDIQCGLTNTGNAAGTVVVGNIVATPTGSGATVATVGDWSLPPTGQTKLVTLRLTADVSPRTESVVSFTLSANGFNISQSLTIYNATADGASPFAALAAGVGRTLQIPVRDRAWVCLADNVDAGARVYNAGDGPILLNVAPYAPSGYVPPIYTQGEILLPGQDKKFTAVEVGAGALLFAIGSREIIPPTGWQPGTCNSVVDVTRGA